MTNVTSKDGTVIAYDKKGQGPNLVLVLGALNKRGSGQELAEALAAHFTVISYDRRGRGDSTEKQPYSIEKEIDDINALIDEFSGSAYLYGHSSGAVLALLAAKKLANKVTSLALYEVPYNADSAAQKASEAYKKELKQLLAERKQSEAVALFMRSVGMADEQIEGMKRLPMWEELAALAPTLAYDSIELMGQYPKTDTRNMMTPALVMYGTESAAFMGETAQKLSRAMPNVTLRPLNGQTHDVEAAALAPVLLEFFQSQASS